MIPILQLSKNSPGFSFSLVVERFSGFSIKNLSSSAFCSFIILSSLAIGLSLHFRSSCCFLPSSLILLLVRFLFLRRLRRSSLYLPARLRSFFDFVVAALASICCCFGFLLRFRPPTLTTFSRSTEVRFFQDCCCCCLLPRRCFFFRR